MPTKSVHLKSSKQVPIRLQIQRSLSAALDDAGVKSANSIAPLFGKSLGSVYTAFDGDDFYFTPLMSRHVAQLGKVPINPESCLGYKPAVDILRTKERVLLYDISLLQKADELWVYTTCDVDSLRWSALAEGLIFELLWYCLSCQQQNSAIRVSVVDISQLLLGTAPDPTPVTIDVSKLLEEVGRSMPDLVARVELLRQAGPVPVVVPIYSLHDAKNASWLRDWIIRNEFAPIVPTLAFDPGSGDGLVQLITGWVWALTHADKVICLRELSGPDSKLAESLRGFVRSTGMHVQEVDWVDVGAPKAVYGEKWPMTSLERADVRRRISRCGQGKSNIKERLHA